MHLIVNSFMLLALASAAMVIFARGAIHSALALILCLCTTAGIWLLLESEFLALILILVYVGAVLVLFLFIIMMLDVEAAALKARLRYTIFGSGFAVAIGLLLYSTVTYNPESLLAKESAVYYAVPNIKSIAQLIFTRFILHFEIAGIILLAAMVAAITLLYQGRRKRQAQDIAKQLKAKPRNRIMLVDGI